MAQTTEDFDADDEGEAATVPEGRMARLERMLAPKPPPDDRGAIPKCRSLEP